MVYDTTKTPDHGARVIFYAGELLEVLEEYEDNVNGTITLNHHVNIAMEDLRRALEDYQNA